MVCMYRVRSGVDPRIPFFNVFYYIVLPEVQIIYGIEYFGYIYSHIKLRLIYKQAYISQKKQMYSLFQNSVFTFDHEQQQNKYALFKKIYIYCSSLLLFISKKTSHLIYNDFEIIRFTLNKHFLIETNNLDRFLPNYFKKDLGNSRSI